VVSAEKVEGADKLVKLIFDIGASENIQIIAGIAQFYPDVSILVGKEIPILTNLEPKIFKGQVSNGMILAVDVDGKPIFLYPEKEVPPGSIVR
jgi:methionyl-tRNA synthetase